MILSLALVSKYLVVQNLHVCMVGCMSLNNFSTTNRWWISFLPTVSFVTNCKKLVCRQFRILQSCMQ